MSDRRKVVPSWKKNNTQADDRRLERRQRNPCGENIEIEGMSSVTFKKADVDYDNEEYSIRMSCRKSLQNTGTATGVLFADETHFNIYKKGGSTNR